MKRMHKKSSHRLCQSAVCGASFFICRARVKTMPSPVSINVYDLHPVNEYLHWAGLGKIEETER